MKNKEVKEKPTPYQFGYQDGGYDEESGWMIEGGEEAYDEALKEWENENN